MRSASSKGRRTFFQSLCVAVQATLNKGGEPSERLLHPSAGKAFGMACSPIVGYEEMECILFQSVTTDFNAACLMEADLSTAELSSFCQSLGNLAGE